ncbi:hypothetical protein HHK36_017601 [Tetracentron sinense]|uniref:Uncharacterized protein n=1 Tax=Tetracentron sinense TaxID=13715 RepID=A0A834YX54_TETSI|nr:hypothetical protein HHK36_017601 [Tetracentron sinense]
MVQLSGETIEVKKESLDGKQGVVNFMKSSLKKPSSEPGARKQHRALAGFRLALLSGGASNSNAGGVEQQGTVWMSNYAQAVGSYGNGTAQASGLPGGQVGYGGGYGVAQSSPGDSQNGVKGIHICIFCYNPFSSRLVYFPTVIQFWTMKVRVEAVFVLFSDALSIVNPPPATACQHGKENMLLML